MQPDRNANAPGGQPRAATVERAGSAISNPQYSTSHRTRSIPVRVGGRVVGFVRGDTFTKRVQASRHFLRKPPAIAFDVQSLITAQRLGATRVEVTDTESGRVYRVQLETIRARGVRVNRGFGDQLALLLHEWNISDSERVE